MSPPLREEFLLSLRRHVDRAAGFSEEFLQPVLGGARTVAVLSRPLDARTRTGWVICHSFGIEHVHLGRLDVEVARALAAAGFPVLRYHGQGYGDSDRGAEELGLVSHLNDATDAVALMRSMDGVQRVGVIGARFGGAVAALVADREDLADLAVWDPVVLGAQFVRELMRRKVISEMTRKAETAPTMGDLRRELDANGAVDVGGLFLTRRAVDEITPMDLGRDLVRFSGRALVVGISRSGRMPGRVTTLAGRLRSLGADCTVSSVQDPLAAEFGRYHYRTDAKTGDRRDTLLPTMRALSTLVTSWAAGSEGGAGGELSASTAGGRERG